MTPWDTPEMRGLGEERLRLLREAAEKSEGKAGMERLDVFLEYGERLAAGGALPPEEQKALLAAAAAGMPEAERARLAQIMAMLGL